MGTAPSQTPDFPNSHLSHFSEEVLQATGGLVSAPACKIDIVISASSPEVSTSKPTPSGKGRLQAPPTSPAGKSHFLSSNSKEYERLFQPQEQAALGQPQSLLGLSVSQTVPNLCSRVDAFNPAPTRGCQAHVQGFHTPSPHTQHKQKTKTKKSSLYCLINKLALEG